MKLQLPPLDDLARKVAPSGSTLQREHWTILAAGFGAGLLLWLFGLLFVGPRWVPGAFGMFVMVHAGIVAAGSMPDAWISHRLDAMLDRWVRGKRGGACYGIVAFSMFVGSELSDLFDPRDGLLSGWSFVEDQVWEHVIGFSAGSITHMISAAIWPWKMLAQSGALVTAIFAASCWAVYSLARVWLPSPRFEALPKTADVVTPPATPSEPDAP
ncbi:MAG TPA: hypothetical protein VFN29_04600 [Chiayiivirga sp.]|nr:hypothetical protein [Chiayiivirga sp.]